MKTPHHFSSIAEVTKHLHELFPEQLKLATPLGLGKPNELLNAVYQSFKDRKKRLSIYTALSLEPPHFQEELTQRLFIPIQKRIWGEDYPSLLYSQEAKSDQLPENLQVHEFYFQAGSALNSEVLQRGYQSVNYTHAAGNVFRAGVQVILQLVAYKEESGKRRYSFSCNPDMTLDVHDLYQEHGKDLLVIGVLHPELPFMGGDAEVSEDFFHALVESAEVTAPLFALPRMPMDLEDHLIGIYASSWVEDGGTLQIGIGSLSDALVNAMIWRQHENSKYRSLLEDLKVSTISSEPFVKGLYGLTEMLTDGFMHLRKAGVLCREVIDENSGEKTYLHGSFFLGSKDFYQWLREMPEDEKKGLRMTRVSKVNDIYDPNELLLRKQRKKARFFNTTMQVTLLGDAMSETLPDGKVVSGVGGQYNFVAMSHELKDSRSVLMLRSTREDSRGRRISNILWEPGHVTIPRHLRDLVITEYGCADLRGKTDEECIQALLNITDSQFQEELLKKAKKGRKLAKDYQIPPEYRNNHPEILKRKLATPERAQHFAPFALGSDFTPEEENLLLALLTIKSEKKNPMSLLLQLLKPKNNKSQFANELKRMSLFTTSSLKEWIYQRLLLAFLKDQRDIYS